MTAKGVTAALRAYHEHNAARARPELIACIEASGAVALVSDAGTPLISDPGYKLVRAAIEAGLEVFAVPGPSAALAALTVSGLPSDKFMFAGFLAAKSEARRRALAEVAAVPASLIFFDSPRRLAETLRDMREILGPRPAAVAREITKLHEEVRRGTLAELADHYGAAEPPKGEIVIVVGPPPAPEAPDVAEVDTRLRAALESGASVRDAVAAVAAETRLPRHGVYARALALAGRKADTDRD